MDKETARIWLKPINDSPEMGRVVWEPLAAEAVVQMHKILRLTSPVCPIRPDNHVPGKKEIPPHVYSRNHLR